MITHDYKLIFIHIPKCGGRSVSEIFNQRFEHFTAYHYYREYLHFWKQYDVFAIVRNPYDRLVSMYHFIQQHRRVSKEPIGCNGAPFKEWVIKNIDESLKHPFFDINSPEAEWGKDHELGSAFWFSPQVRWLGYDDLNGSTNITCFMIEGGMGPLESWLKEKGVPSPIIPHLNASKHDDYKTYYDQELLEYLEGKAFIQEDCVTLGYKFEDRIYSEVKI